MPLGGLCLSGCCGCTFLNDHFTSWSATSGTSPARLGPHWNVISGDWQIGGPDLEGLLVSANGSQLGYIGGGVAAPPQYQAMFDLSPISVDNPPDGSVLRLYPFCSGTTAPSGSAPYIEYGFGTGSQNYVKFVGNSTHTVSGVNVSDGSFGFTVAKNNVGSDYTVFGNTSASTGGVAGYMTISPPFGGSSFVLTCPTLTGQAVFDWTSGINYLSKQCIFGATLPGPYVPQLSVTLSGASGSGCCSTLSGTFVLSGGANPTVGIYSHSGTVAGCSVSIQLSNQGFIISGGAFQTKYFLTVSVTGGSGQFSAGAAVYKNGWADFRSSQLGTLTFDEWTGAGGFGSPANTLGCSFSGLTATVTSLSDGPGW